MERNVNTVSEEIYNAIPFDEPRRSKFIEEVIIDEPCVAMSAPEVINEQIRRNWLMLSIATNNLIEGLDPETPWVAKVIRILTNT